jgi:hypothetical protein
VIDVCGAVPRIVEFPVLELAGVTLLVTGGLKFVAEQTGLRGSKHRRGN